jgi:TorA maturation chaperone TorD
MKDLARVIDFRGEFYRLLSSFFLKEASVELLETLSSLPLPPMRSEKSIGNLIPPKGKEVKSFKEELDVDFARIFLGLNSPGAFPYESVYRTKLGLLMQDPFDEVRDFYGKMGFKKNPGLKEPEDHIAIELTFMANLAHQAGMALKNDKKQEALTHLEQQREFLRQHLSPWVPSFCKDIQEVAWTEFFKSLASLLNAWISSDSEELDRLIRLLRAKG